MRHFMIVTNSTSQAEQFRGLSDEDLMVNYSLGDADAFETLYHRNKGPLYRYFLRQLGQAALAEEFSHEVWLRIIKSRQSYLPKAKFTTYLFQIARNHLIDYFRKNSEVHEINYDDSVDEVHESIGAAVVESAIDRDKQRNLMSSLVRQLPSEQREVFLLKQEGNLSIEEIAQVIAENSETVKSRLRYALKKLKEGLMPFITE